MGLSNSTELGTPSEDGFHEMFHEIDRIANSKINGSKYLTYSDYYTGQNGKTLNQVLEEEANEYKKSIKDQLIASGKYSKVGAWSVYMSMNDELDALTPLERSDVSDIWSGLTKGKVGEGHKPSYWKNNKASVEAFAEMGSATLVNPESLSQIKKYFPKSYDFWLEMLEHYGKI